MRRFIHIRHAVAILLVLGAFSASALFIAPETARATPSHDIDRPPPDPIYEVEPGERPGYLWAAGCWVKQGEKLVWQRGRWIAENPGYIWVDDAWEKRGKKWRYVKGHWEPDEDAFTEEDVTEDEAATAHAPAKHAKPVKRVVKKTNYRDKKLYPPVQRY